jgi:hypothetical protein
MLAVEVLMLCQQRPQLSGERAAGPMIDHHID